MCYERSIICENEVYSKKFHFKFKEVSVILEVENLKKSGIVSRIVKYKYFSF